MIYNVNIGILGHVDSGKTSLCKRLSTIASTACFDKHPQSKERGITLDLGFSSFLIDGTPEHLQQQGHHFTGIQYTLVDCPGHASLIRTIIGGAQIIDLMILVIDIVKGVQTQTAECLVIGEITCDKLIIALNKVDLIPPEKREATVDRMKKRLWKTVENGKFVKCPIVTVSANPGGAEERNVDEDCVGVAELMRCVHSMAPSPAECRTFVDAPLLLAVDHCFAIRGQGTVMTGTVLSGTLRIGDTVEVPSCNVSKKVKSMQIFRKPVEKASQGDRVGVCVTQFDAGQLERGVACSPPGYLQMCHAAVLWVHRIPHYKGTISSKSKMHITLGHETVMAHLTLFNSHNVTEESIPPAANGPWDEHPVWKHEFHYLDQWPEEARNFQSLMLVEFERPVLCHHHEATPPEVAKFPRVPPTLIIGSRLDSEITANVCRLAFHGHVLVAMKDPDYRRNLLPKLKIYRMKSRRGLIERMPSPQEAIVKQLFKKETNLEVFQGLKVHLATSSKVLDDDTSQAGQPGESSENPVWGIIQGGFGQSGKCKVVFREEVPEEIYHRYAASSKKNKGQAAAASGEDDSTKRGEAVQVVLQFKRYMFDSQKRLIQ